MSARSSPLHTHTPAHPHISRHAHTHIMHDRSQLYCQATISQVVRCPTCPYTKASAHMPPIARAGYGANSAHPSGKMPRGMLTQLCQDPHACHHITLTFMQWRAECTHNSKWACGTHIGLHKDQHMSDKTKLRKVCHHIPAHSYQHIHTIKNEGWTRRAETHASDKTAVRHAHRSTQRLIHETHTT